MSPFQLPSALSAIHLDELLQLCVTDGCSDVVLTTEQPLRVKRRGLYLQVSDRPLRSEEITLLIEHMAGTGDAPSRVAGGAPMDFGYEVICGADARKFGFRVNAIGIQVTGGRAGYEVTIRALAEHPPTLEDQGLVDPVLCHALTCGQHGLYLTAGATSSGKTTLQSAVAVALAQAGRRVVTYEAPVEYQLSSFGVSQTAVPRQVASFEDAVISAMRRAPDVMVFGEARDPGTMRGVLTAAETGHAVFSSIHAPSVAGVLPRLVEAFPRESQRGIARRLVDTLRVVIYQKLVPTLIGSRTAIREHLVFTPEVRAILAKVDPEQLGAEIAKCVGSHGVALADDARAKFAAGLVSREVMDSIIATQEAT